MQIKNKFGAKIFISLFILVIVCVTAISVYSYRNKPDTTALNGEPNKNLTQLAVDSRIEINKKYASKPIKLSAINSQFNSLYEEANPNSKNYDPKMVKKYIDDNIQKMLDLLDEAGKSGTDLVCTYEDFKGCSEFFRYRDDMKLFPSLAEEIPGPTSEKIGAIAKQYGMYIAADYYEKDGSKIYNTTVLIGRDGKIVGKYRKVHLPVSEKWFVTAGDEFPVFETDIGRIGIAICYDIVFPEDFRTLALNGADIILNPTQGWGINSTSSSELGKALIEVRAAENEVYLVIAKHSQYGGDGMSCIVSNTGEILEQVKGRTEGIATAEFTPDFDLIRDEHFDALFSGVDSIKARQFLERRPEIYSALTGKDSPLLEGYKDQRLKLLPDEIKDISKQWNDIIKAGLENRIIDSKYHW